MDKNPAEQFYVFPDIGQESLQSGLLEREGQRCHESDRWMD